MQALGTPKHAGFLKKEGGNFKRFQRRYFALHNHVLYYAENPTDKPAGFIDLSSPGCEIQEVDPKKQTFHIAGPMLKRTYKITAETDADYKTWVAVLIETINAAGGKGGNGAQKSSEEGTLYSQSQKKVSIEDFQILSVLGRGCFGKVMKVLHKETKQIYAMKTLSKDMVIRENMVTHTKVEKSILQSIKHPYIVSLRFAFQSRDKLYLVLDYLAGGELFFHLRNVRTFAEDRARFYAAQILMALEHLHSNNIIYRDLKPENCVLDKFGHCCLTDFGLAKNMVSNTPTFTFCGTPEYLAPEVLTETGHSKAVDWWSLGIFIYEMLVGRPPFQSDNVNELYEMILKSPVVFPQSLSPRAVSLIKSLLERDPKKRLGSVNDGKDIRAHEFFTPIDFDALYNRKLPPPFVPQLDNEADDKYFSEEFLRERPVDSVVHSTNTDEVKNFEGFTYVDNQYLK